MSPVLNLVVLRAREPERLADFYTALGLEFVTEKHGTGPLHHAAHLGDTLLEIYPQVSGPGGCERGNHRLAG